MREAAAQNFMTHGFHLLEPKLIFHTIWVGMNLCQQQQTLRVHTEDLARFAAQVAQSKRDKIAQSTESKKPCAFWTHVSNVERGLLKHYAYNLFTLEKQIAQQDEEEIVLPESNESKAAAAYQCVLWA